MVIYITMISVLGLLAMVVSLWDKFAQPKYRAFRAGVFVAMGLSAIFPAAHMLIVDGLEFMYKRYGAESFPSLLGGWLGLDEDPNT
ncbi:hypothetical protein ANCDUO_21915, partial [Ancylostoma duodenale]